jgi:probable rRNA maturation factor
MPQDFEISVTNQQTRHPVDQEQLREAARAVLADSRFTTATVSIAVIDDRAMHELNRRYLNHDWPTDVLSFVLNEQDEHLEGEVVISADTAATAAGEAGWSAQAEQLLYVVHGTLHLAGYRDKTPADARRMRVAESKYLRQLGFEPPDPGENNPDAPAQVRGGATAR